MAKPRSSKAEIIRIVSECVDMLANNATKTDVIKYLEDKYKLTKHTAIDYYSKAIDHLYSDLEEKVQSVRNKRIHSLHKDIKEAYKNYLEEEHPAVKVKWYAQYQAVKAQLDEFYPNALRHESERDEMKIEINYRAITERPSEDE